MNESEQQEYFQKIIESQKLIDSVGEAEFAKIMTDKRAEMETLFKSYSPFLEENAINIIAQCALIIDTYHSHETTENTKRREHFEHLLVSCFNVGYALGVGKDFPAALPIMALSGLNIAMGNKILLAKKKLLKEQENPQKE